MNIEIFLLFLILASGFYMAWSIGANDVANAMGTSVGSAALTLRQAVLIAAVLEFTGAFFFGSHVSETIQKGIINSSLFEGEWRSLVSGMLAALLSAGAWLQLASYCGWPVSTTHTIVGAVVGFGIVAIGVEAVYWENIFFIGTSWILSPLLGGALSFSLFSLLRRKVFFAQSPLKQAKRITPILTFFAAVTITLLITSSHPSHPFLSFYTLLTALFFGSLSSLAAFFALRFIQPLAPSELSSSHTLEPEVVAELAKLKKQLERIKVAADKELRYHLTLISEEMKHLLEAVQQRQTPRCGEYDAVERIFGWLQIITASLMAFAHGANDVANAIGPLAAAYTAAITQSTALSAEVPSWMLALGGVGIIVGLATWGWRVIETIGKKITELTPSRGFAAEFGAAITILAASRLGLPVSTTHTLVGSVLGVGLARGLEALNLATMRDIVISWVITVPAGALLAAAMYPILHAMINAFF